MTRVKICGITRPEDAELAAGLGAWALGMIFWPQSPRACTIEAAEEIAGFRRRAALTGVFVNATLDEVAATAERAELAMVQLHGDEGPAYCAEIARRTGCKVIKAMRVKDASQVAALRSFSTDFHMLDTFVQGVQGGTGKPFDWELARQHAGGVPLVLSGGLTPGNVGEAIRVAAPFAVDSASGTEAEPGRKDPELVRAFFENVTAADQSAAAA